MKGYILWGVNNIYSVRADNGRVYESRIKGKVLERAERHHNALVAGDIVELMDLDDGNEEAMIVRADKRENSLWRHNLKTRSKQTIVANIDQVLIVVSGQNPSFRPGFLDRALVVAHAEHLPVLIVMNKRDQGMREEDVELWNFYRAHFPTVLTSATTGYGMEKLTGLLAGKKSAIFGQSGVGKSTIVNALFPDANQQTQSISEKYNRGRHTTVYSLTFENPEFRLIDTPGIKEFDITGADRHDIEASFPELTPFIGKCQFSNCSHLHEPNCAVRRAEEEGYILPSRWESFLTLVRSVQ